MAWALPSRGEAGPRRGGADSKDAGDVSPEECLRQAEAAKEAGNVFFKRGDAVEALAKYKEGLEFTGLFHEKTPARQRSAEQQRRAAAVYLALHLNSAQACLKQRDWARAAQHADLVLKVDRQNLKALYRRAVARSNSDSTLEEACADFSRVLELDPSNNEAQAHLERTQDMLRTFYDLLGAHPGATSAQIRHAYLREAKRWHPDKASHEDKALAEKRFKEIAEAHEVLRDKKQRQQYDLYLRCRRQGYVEFEDPEDPTGGCVQVPFQDWNDFRRVLDCGVTSADAQQEASDWQSAPDDVDDPPLSVLEWLIAGSLVLGVWCVSVWRHNRRQWLKALPLDIWLVHEDYIMPLGLLMSPFFFGNVPFEQTARWMHAMVGEIMVP